MIQAEQLRDLIIIPTLKDLNLYSLSAVNLILGTAAVESDMGFFLKQVKGPALGIYQMEPDTFEDIFKNYLSNRPVLAKSFAQTLSVDLSEKLDPNIMIWNLKLATAMCRIHYLRVPEKLPYWGDIEGLANYWKRYYNTVYGKGTISNFLKKYKEYVKGVV